MATEYCGTLIMMGRDGTSLRAESMEKSVDIAAVEKKNELHFITFRDHS